MLQVLFKDLKQACEIKVFRGSEDTRITLKRMQGRLELELGDWEVQIKT